MFQVQEHIKKNIEGNEQVLNVSFWFSWLQKNFDEIPPPPLSRGSLQCECWYEVQAGMDAHTWLLWISIFTILIGFGSWYFSVWFCFYFILTLTLALWQPGQALGLVYLPICKQIIWTFFFFKTKLLKSLCLFAWISWIEDFICGWFLLLLRRLHSMACNEHNLINV